MLISCLQRWTYTCAAIVVVCVGVSNANADVLLSVTSATVTQPGELTRICVLMDDGGEIVAGTQNDLVWDGNCATIEEPPGFSCTANARHGKQLSAAFPPRTDFTLRGFVLSLNDTDPINETELYCCNVRSELTDPGTSCSISITRVGASTPDGKALSARGGGPARITYAGSSQNQPRPGRVQPSRPISAVGGNVAGPGQAETGESAPLADAGPNSGSTEPEPLVVQGGGQRVEDPVGGEAQRVPEAAPGQPVQEAAPQGVDASAPVAPGARVVQPALEVTGAGTEAPDAGEPTAAAEVISETPVTQTTPKPNDEASPGSTAATSASPAATSASPAATSASPAATAAVPATEAAAKTEVATVKPTTASSVKPTIKPTAPATQVSTESTDDDEGWGCQIRRGYDSGSAGPVDLAGLVALLAPALLLILRPTLAVRGNQMHERLSHRRHLSPPTAVVPLTGRVPHGGNRMYERLSRCAVRTRRLAAQLLIAAGLMILCGSTQAQAATLEVTSATVAGKGDTAKICVSLKTDGDKVAGTQNDLTWDGACATLADKDQCEANPAHGKDLNAALPSENTMRSFVLSLSDVDIIPDTELYCCNFRSELSAAGSCCDIGISRTGASTPDGIAIDTTGKPGKICLGEAAPAAAAPAPVATEQSDPGVAPWVIALVVVVVVAVAAGVMFSRKS